MTDLLDTDTGPILVRLLVYVVPGESYGEKFRLAFS